MVTQVPSQLRAAVDASASWYDALCALHEVPCGIEHDIWRSYAPPPPLHSVAKTLEPTARPDPALRVMEAYEHGSIADSFGHLDLSAEGYDLLFEAQWIHRPPEPAPARSLPPGWILLRTAAELQRWTSHHDTEQVLLPSLLERSSFCVLGERRDDDYVAGVVLHLGTGVVDISNAWALGPSSKWPAMVAAAGALFPGRALVGYEYGTDLDRAQEAGFAATGPQRVWVR
ncbi:MAG TPA: hypothetical protein VFU98_17340 [Microlunatus sp.]|nr:hypothetical protein [Microlunatus sp.]